MTKMSLTVILGPKCLFHWKCKMEPRNNNPKVIRSIFILLYKIKSIVQEIPHKQGKCH